MKKHVFGSVVERVLEKPEIRMKIPQGFSVVALAVLNDPEILETTRNELKKSLEILLPLGKTKFVGKTRRERKARKAEFMKLFDSSRDVFFSRRSHTENENARLMAWHIFTKNAFEGYLSYRQGMSFLSNSSRVRYYLNVAANREKEIQNHILKCVEAKTFRKRKLKKILYHSVGYALGFSIGFAAVIGFKIAMQEILMLEPTHAPAPEADINALRGFFIDCHASSNHINNRPINFRINDQAPSL